jgi:hypothetical protein
MMYGIANIITPVKTIMSIMGFWNIPTTLNDSLGTKYEFLERAVRVIG